MKTLIKKSHIKELRDIQERNKDGVLLPSEVVEYAKDEDTELHKKFEWDDSIAGYQYRIWQARQIIRIVVVNDPTTNREIRAYISLTPDRNEEGGGYRDIYDVVGNIDWRRQMLRDAQEELLAFQDKYKLLKELSVVFEAIKQIRIK